jgi:hypothetical protein
VVLLENNNALQCEGKIMGIFTSLFGWDQSMGAINAILASHVIETSGIQQRQMIATQVALIMQQVQRGRSPEVLLGNLSEEPRVVQMNFVALACDDLGIPSPFPSNDWARVKNPYLIGKQVDPQRLAVTVDVIQRQNGMHVTWPGDSVKVNFLRMYEAGMLT